jgi:hypothetical protein
MLKLKDRINLLLRLGEYISNDHPDWNAARQQAYLNNSWFDEQHIQRACNNIVQGFLQEDKLQNWMNGYPFLKNTDDKQMKPLIGIVMAGNIPFVGFHDFLCVWLAGFPMKIKLSSKDTVLWRFILAKLQEWAAETSDHVEIAELLKGCDAYIATGSNNSARYFDYYFQKYPHIIRKNRTSAAILDGNETKETLEKLADDIGSFYGLGCRNVTQLFVPENYDFNLLLQVLKGFESYLLHHKYKNNYDYQLALLLLNKQPYLSNDVFLLCEQSQPFAAISMLHYQFYKDKGKQLQTLRSDDRYQCIVGCGPDLIVPGSSQQPELKDYADGIDTMAFLSQL